MVPISKSTACLQNLLASVNATDAGADADAEIVFMAELPPLGYAMFEIKPAKEQKCTPPVKPTPATAKLHGGHASTAHRSGSLTKKSGASSITNGLVTVDFDTSTGLMSSIALENGPSAKVATTLMWYNASDGQDVDEDRGQSSGAYIFRPNGVYPVQQQSHLLSWLGRGKGRANAVELEVYEGDGVSEAHQVFSDWATLVTRVYKGQKHVEVEWTVGPIPFEDSLGREVVVRYATDLNSIETFYTDANGRAMVPRRRNYRPSWDLNVTEDVAGNYYPVTAAAFIEDEHTQFAVITDRAQGAASLADGELELMVHRRTLVDDRRGVNEALNETMCGCSQCNCPGERGNNGSSGLTFPSLSLFHHLKYSYFPVAHRFPVSHLAFRTGSKGRALVDAVPLRLRRTHSPDAATAPHRPAAAHVFPRNWGV